MHLVANFATGPFGDFVGAADVIRLIPECVDDVREALDAGGLPDAEQRLVRISEPLAWLTSVQVAGSDVGPPLCVEILADRGEVVIVSGRVVIYIDTPSQCEVTVGQSAEVTVIVPTNRSALVVASDEATVTVVVTEGSRGTLVVKSSDARAQIRGHSTLFGIASAHAWHI